MDRRPTAVAWGCGFTGFIQQFCFTHSQSFHTFGDDVIRASKRSLRVDFVPAAPELTRERARVAGVELELHEADVLTYDAESGFDLVLDSGCLHHVLSRDVSKYRARLDQWLLPGGDYVLVHFSKRHALDWNPLGPRRVPKRQIVELFAPLQLEGYEETFFDLSFPVGRSLAGIYRFHRR